uniref:hypothetical protein n=1 Tax=Metasolibacillus meyeri TaxID=1071052 RepID=UPI00187D3E0C
GGTVAVVNQQFQTLPEKALTAIENYQNITLKMQTHWELVAEQFEIEKEMQRLKDGTELDNGNAYGNMVKQLRNSYQVLESLKDELHSTDFPEIYRKTMQSLYPGSYKEMDALSWNVTTMASEEQQYLLDERGITAWPLGHQWTSKFNYPNKADSNDHKEILQEAQERNTKYDNSSLFAVYRFFDWNVMFFVLFIFVLLLWTTVAE